MWRWRTRFDDRRLSGFRPDDAEQWQGRQRAHSIKAVIPGVKTVGQTRLRPTLSEAVEDLHLRLAASDVRATASST